MNTHMSDTVNTGFSFDMQHKLYRWSAANPEKKFADLFNPERMECRTERMVPERSRQILGSNPHPCQNVRATRGYHHAGRAGCLETCTSGSERGMKKPDPETG